MATPLKIHTLRKETDSEKKGYQEDTFSKTVFRKLYCVHTVWLESYNYGKTAKMISPILGCSNEDSDGETIFCLGKMVTTPCYKGRLRRFESSLDTHKRVGLVAI